MYSYIVRFIYPVHLAPGRKLSIGSLTSRSRISPATSIPLTITSHLRSALQNRYRGSPSGYSRDDTLYTAQVIQVLSQRLFIGDRRRPEVSEIGGSYQVGAGAYDSITIGKHR